MSSNSRHVNLFISFIYNNLYVALLYCWGIQLRSVTDALNIFRVFPTGGWRGDPPPFFVIPPIFFENLVPPQIPPVTLSHAPKIVLKFWTVKKSPLFPKNLWKTLIFHVKFHLCCFSYASAVE